jgi:hypothetical protein
VGFARVKNKKSIWRAKPQSQSAAAESQTNQTTISLRLCAFARRKKKKRISLAKPQSRQGLRKSNQSDHKFFAPAFRLPTVGRRTSNAPIIPTQIHQEAMGTDGYF